VVLEQRDDRTPDLPSDDVFKVMFRGEASELATLRSRLGEIPGIYPHHNQRVLEVVRDDAVKLPAVRRLVEHYGLELSEVASFGDTDADIDMLEASGVGVLMANARVTRPVSESIVRTLSNDEDGIGIVLRELFPTSAPFRTW
jgi:hydroxymethylpyrimidine pyrophosphatase-like HAD family hydrolase